MGTAVSTRTRPSGPAYIAKPPPARWLFGSSTAAWIWLIARLWLGWEWLQAGWGEVFGGNMTLRFRDRGEPEYG